MTSSHTYTHRRVGGGGFTYYARSPVTPVRSAPGPGSRPADGVPHFRLGPRSGKLHEETSPSRTHPPAHTCPSPAPSRPHLPVPASLAGVNGPTWHLSPDSPASLPGPGPAAAAFVLLSSSHRPLLPPAPRVPPAAELRPPSLSPASLPRLLGSRRPAVHRPPVHTATRIINPAGVQSDSRGVS